MAGSSTKSNVSGATVVVLGTVATLGIGATIFLLRPKGLVYLILAGAVVVIVVLLLAYYLLLKFLSARKAQPFADSLRQAAGSTPNSISTAASRAKLDDLRRNFETGVAKFKAAGKDLYQLPWYLLIGESGSGKTEAIRHSSIPFPPGLHDQLQGAGGTVNMNWWFTNEAVILDTAGRYLFDEVQPGTSNEWTEFLRLLGQNRPQCPINGLLLVIPANSLILDTADKIEAKAGKIAQQLDRIQRTLDIRFPVFVVVTKCDLINGFREFFDGLSEQRQQHQILGWSNPAPLDEAFNPELVDEHLKKVHARLMQRRMGLLIDPVARESVDARRIDEVDALYALPDSFLRVGPRLRQYLEMVFVAGEWSPKPLFLRGIYFTSSMREGQALDAELAELLGVPVDTLQEAKMWDRDRAFFLRDLFLKKVFPEKGLVTRAVNARKFERNRKLALLFGGFAGTFALLGFTYTGSKQLDTSVRQQADDWKAFEGVDFHIITAPIKSPAKGPAHGIPIYHSRLDDKYAPPTGAARTVGEFHEMLFQQENKQVAIPLVLLPAAGIIDHSVHSADLNTSKKIVYRQIFVRNVMGPLVSAAADKIEAERAAKTWSASATSALGDLIHVRGLAYPDLLSLFSYVVADDATASKNFKDRYATMLEQGMKVVQPVDGNWPAPVHVDDKSLDAGVEQFIADWNSQFAGLAAEYRNLASPGGEPAALQAAQEKIAVVTAALAAKPPQTVAEYDEKVQTWTAAWTAYNKAYQDVSKKLDDLSGGGGAGATSFVEVYKAAHARATEGATEAYNNLLSRFPAGPTTSESAGPGEAPPTDELSKLRSRLTEARDHLGATINAEVVASLGRYDTALIGSSTAAAASPAQRLYVVAHQAYEKTNSAIPATDGTLPAMPVADAQAAVDGMAAALPDQSAPDKAARATLIKNCDTLFDALITPRSNYDRLTRRLEENRKTVKQLIVARAEKLIDQPISRSFSIPLTVIDAVTIPAELNPAAAALVLKDLRDLVKEVQENCDKVIPSKYGYSVPFTLDGNSIKFKVQKRQAEIDAYIADYVDFYEKLLDDATRPSIAASVDWETLLKKQLPGIKSRTINENLRELGQAVATALQQISGAGGNVDKIREGIAAAGQGSATITSAGDDFSKKMSHWRDLGGDSSEARNTLLRLSARDFADGYIISADEKKPSFATLYWNRLTFALLHVIANTPNQAAALVLDKMRSADFRKFPLSLRSPIAIDPAKVGEIRADVDRLVIPKVFTTGADVKSNASVEDGGRINEGDDRDAINRELDRLAGSGFAPADWKTVRGLKAVLDAIPRAGVRYQCEVSIPPDQRSLLASYSAGRQPIGQQFRRVQVEANRIAVGDANDLTDPAGGPLGTLFYPMDCTNGPVEYNFYVDQAAFLARRITAISICAIPPGAKPPWPDNRDPWQALRYLFGHAVRSKDDPTVWHIELIQAVNQTPYALWIRLKFEKPFPDLEDWPQ